MKDHFDLVVIGSGPGGFRAAMAAAKAGKKVALVEKDRPGGGCAWLGTIPSKSLREAALSSSIKTFSAAIARMQAVVREESRVVAGQLERNGVKVFRAHASFLSPHELSLKGGRSASRLQGAHFVIATGARPLERPEYPTSLRGVYNSDTILQLRRLPKRLLIVGAGVIGCEYASVFAQLGSQVTLVDRRNELLRAVDTEVIAALRQEFRERGVKTVLGAALGTLESAGRGLRIKLGRGRWEGEAALVCLGRQPNTAGLDLEFAGVETDERGQIRVDPATFRTSQTHICAVGDVIGPPALAATSAEQGSIASAHLFGLEKHPLPQAFPFGIYTIPEISSFGLHEAESAEKQIPFVVGRAPFRELARGLISGEKNGFIKLLIHRESLQLLGVHVIGAGASELVHIGQVLHSLQAPVDFLVKNVFNYPTFAEAYKVAALNALNQLR
jgi:NAD(P) transhydrogenase